MDPRINGYSAGFSAAEQLAISMGGKPLHSELINKRKEQDATLFAEPMFAGQVHPNELTQKSDAFLANAITKGALSIETNRKDNRNVEQTLDAMSANLGVNLRNVSSFVQEQMQEISRINRQIGEFCTSILGRAIKNDPTLTLGEIATANTIQIFIGNAATTMSTTSNLAIDLADKGMGVITKQTEAAIAVIFDTRTKQVQLLSQQIEVFHKQENNVVDNLLKVQEANMKEQEQHFTRLTKIIEIKEGIKDADFKRDLDQQKADLEKRIQISSIELQEEAQQQQHELAVAQQNINAKLENRKVKDAARQEDRRIELKGEKDRLDHIAEVDKTHVQGQVAMQKNTIDGQVAMHQANKQTEAQNLKTVTDAIPKSPCLIQ